MDIQKRGGRGALHVANFMDCTEESALPLREACAVLGICWSDLQMAPLLQAGAACITIGLHCVFHGVNVLQQRRPAWQRLLQHCRQGCCAACPRASLSSNECQSKKATCNEGATGIREASRFARFWTRGMLLSTEHNLKMSWNAANDHGDVCQDTQSWSCRYAQLMLQSVRVCNMHACVHATPPVST